MSTVTVMVVDDNAATRRMVRDALGRAGYRVVEAADGATARALMASERPRVVLQDLVLPGTDSFALVGELRSLGGPDVSILAFSGFVSKLDEARISAVGFDHIIPKPIAPSALVPIVEAHLPAVTPADAAFGSGRRVVVADDDPLQLKLAAFRLTRFGFDVETAPHGAAALAAARARRPDVIISDVMMPELDGFGLAMALRSDPQLASVPLLLVTSSYIEASDRELARRAGATDLVVRTPELGELVELLRTTLAGNGPVPVVEPTAIADLERERSRRVLRQLERQVMLNTGLARRCSALAAELALMTNIAEVVTQRDVGAALDDALVACFDACGATVGALYQLDDRGALRVRTLADADGSLPAARVATFFGHEDVLRGAIARRESLFIASATAADPVARSLVEAFRASALLVTPLAGPRGPLGALLMVARGREVDADDWRTFAQGIGAQLSQVLTLSRAYADAEAAERKAANHAALLAAVVESAPDFVVHVDRDGRIRFINRVAPPHTYDSVIGKHWVDLIEAEQRPAALYAFQCALSGMTSDLEISALGDALRFYQCRLGPVCEDNDITGCVIVARDVTDKKQTEVQLMLADRMASVGTLAAGVAHEINNPLAAVIANLDMAMQDLETLGQEAMPPDLVDELGDARQAADRVREIVRDLKLFSRTHEDQFGAVNIEKVIDSTLRMASNEIRHRAKLVKEYGGVPRVVANESRLGQVLLNVIVNAVQAIPEGNYENNVIRVSTSATAEHVVVAIRDSGAGMSPEVKQRLFTPFFTTKPVGVGTGLGLAISHRIINAMGGSISFESDIGKGTEFRITLPIAGAHVAPVTQRLPTQAIATRRGRVLVIDDEETLGQAIRRFLAQDHDVDAVTSARHAIETLARGSRYDVILCDLMMPQVTGIELHGSVAKLDPEQAKRMVFVTGGAFTESARAFFETTQNPRIEKPFDLKTLRHLVNELIR